MILFMEIFLFFFVSELFLAVCTNPNSEFHCYSGVCITKIKVCDGFADCADNEDEDPKLCAGKTERALISDFQRQILILISKITKQGFHTCAKFDCE